MVVSKIDLKLFLFVEQPRLSKAGAALSAHPK